MHQNRSLVLDLIEKCFLATVGVIFLGKIFKK